jgi:hypothetical protein
MRKLSIVLLLALFASPAVAQVGTGIGAQPVYYLSAASTNSTLVSAGWHTITSLNVINTTATLYYLKLYNKATAPTCGTDTPVQIIPIPASATGAGVQLPLGPGLGFNLGVGFCLTSGIAASDTGNAATGVAINIGYK